MSKYSKEFKEEALKLSDEIGVKKAALQLGLHSDRGSQYTSDTYRKLLKGYGIIQSALATLTDFRLRMDCWLCRLKN